MPASSRATPTTSPMPSRRKCSGGTRTIASGGGSAGPHSPAPTRANPPKHERGPDAKNTRIARFHLGHTRHGRGSVPLLHAPFPRSANLPACNRLARSASILELQIPLLRAPVHHPLLCVLDSPFGPLHLHSESSSAHLAWTPPLLSRSAQERRSLSCRGRSA